MGKNKIVTLLSQISPRRYFCNIEGFTDLLNVTLLQTKLAGNLPCSSRRLYRQLSVVSSGNPELVFFLFRGGGDNRHDDFRESSTLSPVSPSISCQVLVE